MKSQNLVALAAAAISANAERPATTTVHDSPDARVVLFRLEPGQRVAPHTSTSTVILSAVAGTGVWSGEEGDEHPAQAGDAVVCAPNEPHGMRALAEPFVVLAIIAPRPDGHA